MRSKNVEALRTLLALCDSDTDALQDTWLAVLECISRLEYTTSTPSMAATVMQGSNQISRDAILQSLRDLAGKPAEQVFVNSVKLPSESVVEFFTALCNVSAQELRQNPARVFSLQKLVEISYYNMARIRMVIPYSSSLHVHFTLWWRGNVVVSQVLRCKLNGMEWSHRNIWKFKNCCQTENIGEYSAYCGFFNI